MPTTLLPSEEFGLLGIYFFTCKRPLIWLRYIDDIFCLWPHGPQKLASFNEYLVSCHPKIKFACNSSPHCIDFLHLTEGRLTTELFTKLTASLAYLLRGSYHPRRVFDTLPYGEFVRTRRNCSTIEYFDSHSHRLLQAFGKEATTWTSLKRLGPKLDKFHARTYLTNMPNLSLHK